MKLKHHSLYHFCKWWIMKSLKYRLYIKFQNHAKVLIFKLLKLKDYKNMEDGKKLQITFFNLFHIIHSQI
jgi:hypothetical protein